MVFIKVGVDIGGRHIGMGLVDDDGKIFEKRVIEIKNRNRNIKFVFARINEYLEDFKGKYDFVGIGAPGLCQGSKLVYTCNLPIKNVDINDYIKTDVPVCLGNDAVCAMLGEYKFIDKRKIDNYLYITYGTGIGAGIILNGKLYNGTTGIAGEVGHMVIQQGGRHCSCGRYGCYERYASVYSFLKSVGMNKIGEAIYLTQKNKKVAKVFDEYLEYVAEGLANLINIFDPKIVVIGGSIAYFEDMFLEKLKEKVAKKIFNKYTYELNIKCAKLGNDAGIIGATTLEEF